MSAPKIIFSTSKYSTDYVASVSTHNGTRFDELGRVKNVGGGLWEARQPYKAGGGDIVGFSTSRRGAGEMLRPSKYAGVDREVFHNDERGAIARMHELNETYDRVRISSRCTKTAGGKCVECDYIVEARNLIEKKVKA